MIQVYFHSVPMKYPFIHKGEWYRKIGEERVVDASGKEWHFEVHYGCMVCPLDYERCGMVQRID